MSDYIASHLVTTHTHIYAQLLSEQWQRKILYIYVCLKFNQLNEIFCHELIQ